MPRANSYRLTGYAWHTTHCLHETAFRLKFKRDRGGWRLWAFKAKKRSELPILNYPATVLFGSRRVIRACFRPLNRPSKPEISRPTETNLIVFSVLCRSDVIAQ